LRIAEIMQALPDMPAIGGWRQASGADVAGIASHSRDVQQGFLFAAVQGSRTDGRAFIADAVARGAAAVLAPDATAWPEGVPARPLLQDPQPRRRLAQIAAIFAGVQPEIVVAVTGTNGKTSTVDFLRQIWAMRRPAASLGTLGLNAPGFPPGPGLTTPDPIKLADMLARLARAGIQHIALEASSHGLDQYRLDGLRLTAAAFTNLTRDHLDYHGTETTYRAAKLRLFSELLPMGATAVANADMDSTTLTALREIAARRQLKLRTVGSTGANIRLISVTPHPKGQDIAIETAGRIRHIPFPLPGRFQAENALLAATVAESLGERDALEALPNLTGVRGRMERAAVLPSGAAAYVDYAHTPDALERLLSALRPHTAGRLHVVFGAGGDRDAGKRPLMGAAAARYADQIIVTDDNPRSEDPAVIRAAVRAGCPNAREIGDRACAISAALDALAPGDVLAVAGKGHEQGQEIGGAIIPFDDVSVIRSLVGTS
jgi:UDP-N-acetylmuramoyl-L-alanyl-D-glutamate--2,6-diaminopimelate ligase